jgi:hypothetical protein
MTEAAAIKSPIMVKIIAIPTGIPIGAASKASRAMCSS